MLLRNNEMQVEIIDPLGQRLPIPYEGLVIHASRDAEQVRVLVDGSGMVTNLAQVGLAGNEGERMILTLLREEDGCFTVTRYRRLLDS